MHLRLLVGSLGVVLVGVMLAGCSLVPNPSSEQIIKPDEVTALQEQLTKSLKAWNRLKVEHNDTYRYEVHGGFYLGFGSITTITVRNGKVVARTYEEGQTNNEGALIVEEQYSWTEKGVGIGSHEGGAVPRTVDELYRECRDDVLIRSPRVNRISLEFYNSGVLKSCLYAPKNEVVDAAPGVFIDALEFPPFKDD